MINIRPTCASLAALQFALLGIVPAIFFPLKTGAGCAAGCAEDKLSADGIVPEKTWFERVTKSPAAQPAALLADRYFSVRSTLTERGVKHSLRRCSQSRTMHTYSPRLIPEIAQSFSKTEPISSADLALGQLPRIGWKCWNSKRRILSNSSPTKVFGLDRAEIQSGAIGCAVQ